MKLLGANKVVLRLSQLSEKKQLNSVFKEMFLGKVFCCRLKLFELTLEISQLSK